MAYFAGVQCSVGATVRVHQHMCVDAPTVRLHPRIVACRFHWCDKTCGRAPCCGDWKGVRQGGRVKGGTDIIDSMLRLP
eukprot:353536-Chlamydomonas_euryale.AAC.5